MLYEYQVATTPGCDYIINEFDNRLKWLEQKGFSLYIDSLNTNMFSQTLKLMLAGENSDSLFREEDIVYIFKHQMAEVLAEHIIRDWEEKLLWKEISRNCRGNSLEEKQRLLTKAKVLLNYCNDNEGLNMLMNFRRKNRMSHRLLEHINCSKIIVIEGFINFCMQDYLTEIRFVVDLALEELRNEKEYNEFIKLLRYFVDSQAPKIYEVNLLMDGKSVFYLWDDNGVAVEDTYMSYYLDDILLDEINLDDVLISILITIAPRKIILHNVNEYADCEAVEVIRTVFAEKISICNGCEHCYKYIRESELSKN